MYTYNLCCDYGSHFDSYFSYDIIIEYLETTNIITIFSICAFPLSPVSSNLLLDAAIDEIYLGILIFHAIIFFGGYIEQITIMQ